MSEENNHIDSVNLTVHLPDGVVHSDALGIAEGYYDRYLAPVMDEVISRIGKEHEIAIDSIDIDLGVVNESELHDLFAKKLESSIRRHIQGGRTDMLMMKEEKDGIYPRAETRERFVADTDWTEYLSTGAVPWQFEIEEFKPEEMLLSHLNSMAEDSGAMRQFLSHLRDDVISAYRFVCTFRPEDLKHVLSVVSPYYQPSPTDDSFISGLDPDQMAAFLFTMISGVQQPEILSTYYKFLSGHSGNIPDGMDGIERKRSGISVNPEFAVSGHEMALHDTLSDETTGNEFNDTTQNSSTITVVQKTEWLDSMPDYEGMKTQSSQALSDRPLTKPEGRLTEENRLEMSGKEPDGIADEMIDDSDSPAGIPDRSRKESAIFINGTLKSLQEHMAALAEGSDARNTHYRVEDAGLVLLHPFLPAFFKRVGLLDEDNGFKGIDAKEHACHLLRYLVGTGLRHEDYCLTLEKLICHIPLNSPIRSKHSISEIEKKEARDLLESVCEYWRPLNGTSPEGLQQSFLRRDGILVHEDNNWIVKVEGNAVDILLDDLPWEISVIILPWMKDSILVEWQQNY